jgi:hypothetical protein
MMSQYFIPHIELECRQIGLSFRRLRSSDHKKQPLVRSCEEEGEKEEGGGGEAAQRWATWTERGDMCGLERGDQEHCEGSKQVFYASHLTLKNEN